MPIAAPLNIRPGHEVSLIGKGYLPTIQGLAADLRPLTRGTSAHIQRARHVAGKIDGADGELPGTLDILQ